MPQRPGFSHSAVLPFRPCLPWASPDDPPAWTMQQEQEDALCEVASSSSEGEAGCRSSGIHGAGGGSICGATSVATTLVGGAPNRHKARAGGGGGGGAGGAGNNQKNKRWCRGCRKWLPPEEFAANQTYHFVCKRMRDNISKACARQNESEWFKLIEQDDMKFHELLTEYNKRNPECDQGKGKRAKGKLVVAMLKRIVETSSEILRDDVGELMTKDEFIEWSVTLKGGRRTATEACHVWDEMAARRGELIHDMRGPPTAPLRIRISVKDTVTLRDRYADKRQLEVAQGPVREPGEEKLDKLADSVLTGRDFATCSRASGGELTDVARNMVLSGAGLGADGTITSSFEGGHIGNIRSILPLPESDGQGDDDDVGGAGAGASSGAPAAKRNEPEAGLPRAGAGRPHQLQDAAEVDG